MSARAAGALALLVLGTACAGGSRQAGGPPPEYERPTLPEWDAGKPVDPLEQAAAQGEPVGDPQTPDATPDAGAAGDAGPGAGVR